MVKLNENSKNNKYLCLLCRILYKRLWLKILASDKTTFRRCCRNELYNQAVSTIVLNKCSVHLKGTLCNMQNFRENELRQSRHISNVRINREFTLSPHSVLRFKWREMCQCVNCKCLFSTMKVKPNLELVRFSLWKENLIKIIQDHVRLAAWHSL